MLTQQVQRVLLEVMHRNSAIRIKRILPCARAPREFFFSFFFFFFLNSIYISVSLLSGLARRIRCRIFYVSLSRFVIAFCFRSG